MKPTVGRIVHVYTRDTAKQSNWQGEGPYAALVTQVFNDDCINCTVFPLFASIWETASILRQDAAPVGSPQWWNWPPRVPIEPGDYDQAARDQAMLRR